MICLLIKKYIVVLQNLSPSCAIHNYYIGTKKRVRLKYVIYLLVAVLGKPK